MVIDLIAALHFQCDRIHFYPTNITVWNLTGCITYLLHMWDIVQKLDVFILLLSIIFNCIGKKKWDDEDKKRSESREFLFLFIYFIFIFSFLLWKNKNKYTHIQQRAVLFLYTVHIQYIYNSAYFSGVFLFLIFVIDGKIKKNKMWQIYIYF